MSGYFTDDADYANQRRSQMAAALMGGGQHQGPLGGIGDAIMQKALQQRMAQNAYNNAPAQSYQATTPNISGGMSPTTITPPKTPYLGPQGLSGLFSFGGG